MLYIYCGAAREKLPFYRFNVVFIAWCFFGWPLPELCKRPCSGLVKVMAKLKHTRNLDSKHDTTVCDWIGGFCPADSLMVWFPAHWAPVVIRELERKEQDHRTQFPQWFDGWVSHKYQQQQRDACASRTLQFEKRPYLDSPIQLLTASIRVDWFSMPEQRYLNRLPRLRQGLTRGVFFVKASSPWGSYKSARLQVSLCVPNDRDLDTWFDAVYALPIAWPDITDIGSRYAQRTTAAQLHTLRNQLGVSHMWGELSPNRSLLEHHLWNNGPNFLDARQLEELLTLNRPCRPGDDVRDHRRPYTHVAHWQQWEQARAEMKEFCIESAPLTFVTEEEAIGHIQQVIHEEEQAMGIQYEQPKEHELQKDDRATKRRRKDDHTPTMYGR